MKKWTKDTLEDLVKNCANELVREFAAMILRLREENERLRTKVLNAAGDDLCRLSQEEIKSMSAGKVKIPPLPEFIASCGRFHAQVAAESGVLHGGKTIAQLEAENEELLGRIKILDEWKRENKA